MGVVNFLIFDTLDESILNVLCVPPYGTINVTLKQPVHSAQSTPRVQSYLVLSDAMRCDAP